MPKNKDIYPIICAFCVRKFDDISKYEKHLSCHEEIDIKDKNMLIKSLRSSHRRFTEAISRKANAEVSLKASINKEEKKLLLKKAAIVSILKYHDCMDEKIEKVELAKNESQLDTYVMYNLKKYHDAFIDSRIKFSVRRNSKKKKPTKSSNYHDQTSSSIRALSTPMGNRR